MMIAWVVCVSVLSALMCQKQGVWVSGILENMIAVQTRSINRLLSIMECCLMHVRAR